jgi:hypothetical protein
MAEGEVPTLRLKQFGVGVLQEMKGVREVRRKKERGRREDVYRLVRQSRRSTEVR